MEAVLPMRRRSYGSIRSPIVKRDSESLVVLKGWLHKLEGGAIKQWKPRWCVLSDFCLFFYKSPNEEKVFTTVLLPSYKINPCDSEDRISRKYAFKAEHHNMKTYYFASENKESMKRWMNAMSLASIMQNFGRNDVVESGVHSMSHEEEDSGFTSYRSRRFEEQDPDSTFNTSYGSNGLWQKTQSCSERVDELYLSSDDKYPSLSKRHQHHSRNSEGNPRPRQPLYANAPPKPRRMVQSDPFAISPGEQYNEMEYNMVSNPIKYQDFPETYGYPNVIPYTGHTSNVKNLQTMDHYQYEPNHQYPNEIAQEFEHIDYGNSYRKTFGVDVIDGSNGIEQIQRPHSADFLERDAESFSPVQSQEHSTRQRQRPKSSMEYYSHYWDTDDYSAESYREAVRMQADNLYTGSNTKNTQHHHSTMDDMKYKSAYRDPYVQNQDIVDPQLNQSYERKYYPSHGQPSTVVNVKKKQEHEESMKRLLEWKQRMLQSPLTRRVAQYSSSSSETGSPRRPPTRPPLPHEYRDQVIQELESHEAQLRKQGAFHESPKNYIPPSPASSKSDQRYSAGPTISTATVRSLPSADRVPFHQNDVNDLNYSKNGYVPNQDIVKSERDRVPNNVMYCVDSENNEILIYDDNYVADVPAKDGDGRHMRRHSEKSKPSSASDFETNLVRCSSGSGSVFFPPSGPKPVAQGCSLRRSAAQKLNISYSSDDEASSDINHRHKRSSSRNKSSLSRTKNASDSDIHVREPQYLQKLILLSENVMNKGKRLSVSAGDLLGKTHEELVLLLIQLRRNQARLLRAKEKCLSHERHFTHCDNGKSTSHAGENSQQAYVHNCNDIIQQLDKQLEVTRPLISLVDNMVKLGSLYGSSSEERSSSNLHMSTPDLNRSEDRVHPTELHAWSSMEDSDFQEHVTDIYGFDQETHCYSALQQDKEMLETTLHGMKNKILDHQDKPFELQKLRKQQRLIEKELTRVKRLLFQSAKKIEDATTKNDQLEQEILLLRQKLQQALKTGSSELKSSQSRADLEAELSRVQNVLEELANHRQEINNTVETLKNDALTRASCASRVRASPTGVAGSAPLPLRKKQQSTYLETDLDTMATYDLSNICRELDDIPVYANAEEISHVSVSDSPDVRETLVAVSSTGSDKENLSQCSLQDINEADDKMKRFYGILPREKPCEIKTVRIVKRQSERRNRDKKRVTYGDQSSVWVVEEPDLSSDDHFDVEDDVFKNSSGVRPSTMPLPLFTNVHKSSGVQSAHERLFGTERGKVPTSNSIKTVNRIKRRHYTVSGCQYLNDPQFEFSRDRPRSRDDVDMERCLRTANTPDIVRSTIKKKEVFDDEIIDRELGLPEKISIPERYVEDEPENLSASERLRRSLKAENIRKMLSETTASYENIAKNPTEPVHKTFTDQKRKRAHLLALNHALAQEVMERSKAVAATNFGPDTSTT